MKKAILLLLLIVVCIAVLPTQTAYAEEEVKSEEELLEEQVKTQLDEMDFSELNDLVEDDNLDITNESFKGMVDNLINGQSITDVKTVLGKILSRMFKEIRSLIPIIFMIVAIAVLGNIVSSFQPTSNSKTISDITHFVCVAVVIVLIVSIINNVYTSTAECISAMANQMSILFPILLTLLTAMGSVVSVGIYQPIVAILTGGVAVVFKRIVFPIFVLSLIFVILNNLSNDIKLNKFISFLSSSFKWIVGFVFTLFAGFLTIQGISAGKYDTISLKATRFAMKSYVPVVGGYLSEGLDYIMLSSILIKNAIGVAGLLILLGTILVPIITILILKLGLQFVAGIIEPMGNNRISNLCEDLSKVLIFPIVVILAMAFMYVLSVGLIMCTISGV